jgi:uncharacterized protein (TIGR00730 family)
VKSTVVTVFGSSAPAALSPPYQLALELGRAIAEAGWVLCNGGYGGTMEAAARGAAEAGGHTIGVTCSALRWRGGANRYIKQEVPTFDLLARLNTLVRLGDAYVVLPGGTGTLLELALVWELLNKAGLKRSAPLIVLGDHWAPLLEIVRREQPDAIEPATALRVAEVIEVIRRSRAARSPGETNEVLGSSGEAEPVGL